MSESTTAAKEPRLRAGPALRVLLAVNAVAFLVEAYLAGPGLALVGIPADVHVPLGSLEPGRTWTGETWRLLTHAFLHGNLPHVAINLWSLHALGVELELLAGPWGLAAVYVISALGGALASLSGTTGAPSLGASGAVFGVAGALLSFAWIERAHAAERRLGRNLLWVIALNLALGEFFNRGDGPVRIDNMAHVGGLVSGLCAGLWLLGWKRRGPTSVPAVAGAVLLAVALGAGWSRAMHPSENPRYFVARAGAHLERDALEDATAELDTALRLRPHDPLGLATRRELCLRRHDAACASEALEHLLALEPMPPGGEPAAVELTEVSRVLSALAMNALRERDLPLAVVTFRRASQLMPANQHLLNGYAWSLLCRGALSDEEKHAALDAADRARRLAGGESVQIEHTYAEALRQLGRLEEAVDLLEALRRAPETRRMQWTMETAGEIDDAWLASEIDRMRAGRPPEP